MKNHFTIKNYIGEDLTVHAKLALYEVTDYMGRDMHIPAIQLLTEDNEPFATVTKSFGEFIGIKNCCYIDLNNCPFATVLLDEGIAKDTGFTKESGWCSYPLWVFKEEFLKEIGGETYQQYSDEYENYMHGCSPAEDIESEETLNFDQKM